VALNTINQATSNLKQKLSGIKHHKPSHIKPKKKLDVALNTINQATSNLKKKLEVALNTINQATSNLKKNLKWH
jgi:ribosomal protein S7